MIPPKFTLNLNDFKRMFFTRTMQAVNKAQKKNLSLLGGWIRLVAKRSIKDSAKHSRNMQATFLRGSGGELYSRPGQPPLNKVGHLKSGLFYGYDQKTKSVVIGPAKLGGGSGAPAALEHGGRVQVSIGRGARRRIETRAMLPRPYMVPALLQAKKQRKFEHYWKDSVRR